MGGAQRAHHQPEPGRVPHAVCIDEHTPMRARRVGGETSWLPIRQPSAVLKEGCLKG
jgi:hypothetical protein